MKNFICVIVVASLLSACVSRKETTVDGSLRAGAYAMDITPTHFPVTVSGNFFANTASKVNQNLHVRWLVLDDGKMRLALGVMDTLFVPVSFVEEVKARASANTGIPVERIMLSAIHTHSAPSLDQCLGTPPDLNYITYVLPLVVEGLSRAVASLAPAQVGWTATSAPAHTHTRVWIRRPDKMLEDPFGEVTVRANMHPGYQNPDVIGPSGPSDPEMALLAVRSPDGRPIAVLASYAMHYFGAAPISADYFGLFAEKLGKHLDKTGDSPAFVGIMAQGTSGDQHWMDYSQPQRDVAMDTYAEELAQIAVDAYADIVFHSWVPLAMCTRTLRLSTRQPDAKRLAWAQDLVAKKGDRLSKTEPEVYACEQLWLKENPMRDVTLQAVRVGDFGIAIWPCEVFALSGLQVKAQSPFPLTMNIELANGCEGYIPPPELHPLGGYNTWPSRTAGLETNAAPKVVEALTEMLEKVSGQPRHKVTTSHGAYARAVLAARPMAYWRLEELSGMHVRDATGKNNDATYESGIAHWLDGPPSEAFSGANVINRCVHLAGGHISSTFTEIKDTYSVELWFWNGLPVDLRPVTGVLFSRGADVLAIGGTKDTPGRLTFGSLVGQTTLAAKTWTYVALVRNGASVKVYLNGHNEPELSGEVAPDATSVMCVGSGGEKSTTFEGKIDEIALYKRALSTSEIHQRFGLTVQP